MRPGVIIVSNRLPVSVRKTAGGKLEFYPSVSGLATGLASYVKNKKNRWIGWPGIGSDDLSEDDKVAIVTELGKHNCYPVFLTKKQLDGFYNGFSNTILWPAFHDLTFRESDNDHYWQAYRSVNAAFADVVLSLSARGSIVWVHDYQLLLLPALLRAARPKDRIGFFLHIPFPSVDIFRTIPHHKTLLAGMLGSGLIGFHTQNYAENFLQCCRRLSSDAVVTGGQVLLGGRVVQVTDFPMGIDYSKYAEAGQSRAVKKEYRKWQQAYRGRTVILTVDRLDPTKGLVERVTAYQEFLEQNPQLHGSVVLVMIAVPSRTEVKEYKQLKLRLEALVERINKRFDSPGWLPIDYKYTALAFEPLLALYQRADVAFIVPLRDGMNLVAKEYLASKPKGKGILILSETAGAAQELKEAILVNPARHRSLVAGLQKAVTTPSHELQKRFAPMQEQLASHTVQKWAHAFMGRLQRPLPGTPHFTRTLSDKHWREVIWSYQKAARRLLLLDYDGSLVPLSNNFAQTKPPASLCKLLRKLGEQPDTELVLISGRGAATMEKWFGGLPIHLIAEHGASVKRAGQHWQTILGPDQKWKPIVRLVLEKYARKTPGAEVEEKDHALVWHYRRSPPYYAQKYAVTIKRVLKPIAKKFGLEVYSGNKIVEIKPPELNKGVAIRPWTGEAYGFVLAVGDDYTDEDMFAVLPDTAYSVKVGRGRTDAGWRLKAPGDVLRLLKQLTQ